MLLFLRNRYRNWGAGATGVSGGERRRLLAARALASRTHHALDEAGEHLDPHSADALMRNHRAHAVNKAVIVTHRLGALLTLQMIILMGYLTMISLASCTHR